MVIGKADEKSHKVILTPKSKKIKDKKKEKQLKACRKEPER